MSLVFMMSYVGIIFYFRKGILNLKHTDTPRDIPSDYFVSVVIAFRNEAHNLQPLIDDLVHQTLPINQYEVILINDHSTDNWCDCLNGLPDNFRIIDSINNGKKNAIFQATSHAKGPLIVTTDADCRLQPDWLQTMASIAYNTSASLTIGLVNMISNKSLLQNIQQLDYMALQLCGAGAVGINHPIMCSGANLAFLKDDYLELSNQLKANYMSGDDMFLLHAAKRSNKSIAVASSPHSNVYTKPEETLKRFLNQRIRWASKSKGYSDRDTIATAFIVLLANISLIALVIMCFINLFALPILVIALICKSAVEWQLFKEGKTLINIEISKTDFFITVLIHPLYIISTALTGFVANVYWKGRKVEIDKQERSLRVGARLKVS